MLVSLLTCSLLASPQLVVRDTTGGEWIRIVYDFEGESDLDADHCLLGDAYSDAVAVNPDECQGSGWAYDRTPGCDVRAASTAVGVGSELWIYRGAGSPVIEYDMECSAAGEADLLNADCAGAAVGYAAVESPQFWKKGLARLDSSAGETVRQTLGSLKLEFGGAGVSIPVTIGMGTGRYPDRDSDSVVGVSQESWFSVVRKTEAQTVVWADGGWFGLDKAEVEVSMEAAIGGTVSLSRQ